MWEGISTANNWTSDIRTKTEQQRHSCQKSITTPQRSSLTPD